MYQKQILLEKLREACASVLPISLIVLAICFFLVPMDTGLVLSFVLATAMLILGMGFFTLGAEMSMSRIGNYMGSKLTKSRKLWLILSVSFALGVAITIAEPDLQVLAGNVPEIDTMVLILTVSVGRRFLSAIVYGENSLRHPAAPDAADLLCDRIRRCVSLRRGCSLRCL